jgi:SAM-dependent methyltransferase
MPASSPNINNSFFEGQYKEVWRQIIPPGLTEAEADFIEDIAGLEKGDRVLDAMCGYGRHTLELARRGFALTAIDNAHDYILELKNKAGADAMPVTAIEADIAEVELDGVYDAIVCMGNSFAFFPEGEASSVLQKLSGHLKKGGSLILNSWMIAEIAIRHFKDREWHSLPGYKYLIENRFLFHPSRIESVHTMIPDAGAIEERKGIDYIFTLSELERLLSAAGFALREVYGTPRKKKFSLGDGRAYIVADKA